MGKAEIPGLQVAIARNGKVVWHKGFGVKNASTSSPATNETIFEAASLTKPFFAYVVMKMVEEGLIDLDKPLHTYFTREEAEKGLGHSLDAKGFKRGWFEKATGRHILSHSGGFPHGERGDVFPIFFEPGTKWKYSADGYQLLQLVVEKLKGVRSCRNTSSILWEWKKAAWSGVRRMKIRWPPAIMFSAHPRHSENVTKPLLRPVSTPRPVNI
jgi:CubicO group peptidase (beta-lactamase class C family)